MQLHDLIAAGFTQSDLARRLGVSPSTVSRWIAGARLPRPQHGAALALLAGTAISVGSITYQPVNGGNQ